MTPLWAAPEVLRYERVGVKVRGTGSFKLAPAGLGLMLAATQLVAAWQACWLKDGMHVHAAAFPAAPAAVAAPS